MTRSTCVKWKVKLTWFRSIESNTSVDAAKGFAWEVSVGVDSLESGTFWEASRAATAFLAIGSMPVTYGVNNGLGSSVNCL